MASDDHLKRNIERRAVTDGIGVSDEIRSHPVWDELEAIAERLMAEFCGARVWLWRRDFEDDD